MRPDRSSGAEPAERTVVAWCPDWPVVAAGVDVGEPAAVLHANRVVATSPAARAEGVVVGQRRREAQRCCPEVVILAHDPARDARAFEPVVAVLDDVCPRVEVIEPGTCAFAARGPSRYFGGDQALAEQVVARIAGVLEGRGSVQVGVADAAFAATCAARRAEPGRPVVVVAPGESAAFLAPWPVGVLAGAGLEQGSALVDVLGRLGLPTLGAFAALASADVLGRFGADGLLAHRLSRGLDTRPLDARRPGADLSTTAELEPPAERVDTAAFVAKALADALHQRLSVQGLACTRIVVEAETEHGEELARCWRHEGALGAAAIVERVRWQLDGWLSGSAGRRPTGGITQLTLVPDEVVAVRGRQLGFWGGETKVDERVIRALARLEGLLGPEAVTVAEYRGGRAPAERIALVPVGTVDLTEPRPAARPGWVAEPWPGRLPAPSATLVHADPRPVRLTAADGQPVAVTGRALITDPPARLDGESVLAWAGPWPADERWWDATSHRRRARVQVLVAEGVAHLLALEDGQWRLEATYD